MNEYHGIIVKESLNESALKKLNVLSTRMASDGSFTLLKISFPEKSLEDMIKLIQKDLKVGKWYAHFYKDNELIVIFKEKVFRATTEKNTWRSVIDFGLAKRIPKEQMKISPVRTEEETW